MHKIVIEAALSFTLGPINFTVKLICSALRARRALGEGEESAAYASHQTQKSQHIAAYASGGDMIQHGFRQ